MSYDAIAPLGGVTWQTCSWCRVRKPVGEFYRNPSGWITRECRTCAGERLHCWAAVDANPIAGRRYVGDGDELLCKRCGRLLPRSAFYTYRDGKSRRSLYRPKCKQCTCAEQNEYRRVYSRTEDRRRKNRDRWLRTKYGISLAEYEALLAVQDGRCAACRTTDPGGPSPDVAFHVDHSHADGRVRALLCRSCNCALGQLNDDPERIRALLAYLERWPACHRWEAHT